MIDTHPKPGPGLSELLQQIANLDASAWEIGAFDQKAFTSRQKVTNDAQVMQVMRDLGSKNVKSIDIENALGLSRAGCLKRLRKMVLDGLVTKIISSCKNTTWSIR